MDEEFEDEMDCSSNCCGAPIMGADYDGYGKCSNCKENCVEAHLIE